MPSREANVDADAGSESSDNSRLRMGSIATAAAAGSSMICTASMHQLSLDKFCCQGRLTRYRDRPAERDVQLPDRNALFWNAGEDFRQEMRIKQTSNATARI